MNDFQIELSEKIDPIIQQAILKYYSGDYEDIDFKDFLYNLGIVYDNNSERYVNKRNIVTIDRIIKIVLIDVELSFNEMYQNRNIRKKEYRENRQIMMYFSKLLTKASLPQIGSKVFGKDHATVLHAYKVISNLIETDKVFKNRIEKLQKKIILGDI